LVPAQGQNQVATDIAYGTLTAEPHYNWLSFVLPFGAQNSIVSVPAFVDPLLNYMKSPSFCMFIQQNCGLPPSNYTLIDKKIQFQGGSWATTGGRTSPVFGAAPSSFSSISLLALPVVSSLAAFLYHKA